MNDASKIILVRHGESVYNEQDIIGGDPTLTSKGREQACQAREELNRLGFGEVYSSDRKRAIETAEIISGKKLPPDHKLSELREKHYGSLEEESNKHFDDEHAVRIGLSPEEDWIYKHVDDAESDKESSARMITTIEKIAKLNPGKTILMVSHSGAIRSCLMKLLGKTYKDLPHGVFKNTGYVQLQFANDELKVIKVVGMGTSKETLRLV